MVGLMLSRILSICMALLGAAGAAQAQGAADRLQSVLASVPVAAMEGGSGPIIAGFGNGDAVRWIAVRAAQNGQIPDTPNRFAALRSSAPNQQAAFLAHDDAAIRAAVGLIASDWVETWEVAQGPVRIGAMDIFPDSEMRLRGALFSRGFTEEERAGLPVMWIGAVDHEPVATRIDPANPFGGDAGLPLRMAFTGNRAIWATGWTALDLASAPRGETLADRPDAGALIGGLRRVGNLGALVSVRCWLRNGATVPVAGAADGPVEAVALADFAIRETEGAAMVLVLADGIDVDALAARLVDAWPVLSDLPSPAPPEVTSGGSTITVTMSGGWGSDAAETNDAYKVFESVLAGGRLGFLIQR